MTGGLLLAAAFPPWDLWFLAPLGPAALAFVVRGRPARTAFGLGFAFGAAFFAVLLSWLWNLGVLPWLLLTVTQSVFTGLLGVALAVGWRLPARLVVMPCMWVAVEALRARFPLGGFPWGRLGFSQADAPTASVVAVGGIPFLSLVIASAGIGVVVLALSSTVRACPKRTAARMGLLVLIPVAVTSGAHAYSDAQSRGAQGAVVTVAVVQGNVPRARTLEEQARAARVTENHVEATLALAERVRSGEVPAPDLVIWPESSSDVDPQSNPKVYDLIEGAVTAIDRPLLIGAVLEAPDGRALNAGQLWLPGRGPVDAYVKRHLVPFGEYIPMRSLLGGLGDLALIERDFVAGKGPQVLSAGSIRIGDIICYEVAYDDEGRDAVGAGANLLVVQSNNATYMRDGQKGETLQQLAMARLRALELDRAVVVATPTGISAVVEPDGSVVERTDIWTRETLVSQVELRTTRTLASRMGNWLEWVVAAAAAMGLASVTVQRRLAGPQGLRGRIVRASGGTG